MKNPLALFLSLSIFLICSTANAAHYTDQLELDSGIILFGPLAQGGMVLGKAPKGSTLSLAGKPVRVTDEGEFVIGFGRDAETDQHLQVKLPDGRQYDHRLTIEKRSYKIQRIEGVPQKTVSPDPADLERIRQESRMVKAARSTNSDLLYFLDGFEWPLLGPITGVYGSQRYYNGEPRRPHYGLDIAGPVGAQVRAPQSGVVTLAHDNMFYSGGTLIIDHGYGISSTFIHLSKVLVKVGDKVNKGQVIAEVGQGGRATGPHLDWRINWYQIRLDPGLIMPPMPEP